MSNLVLASTSRTRIEMLQRAGLSFTTLAPNVDEATLRDRRLASAPATSPEEIAIMLADAKALDVSRRRPGALVIGADQVLAFEGRCLAKPTSTAEARATLESLRGRRHALVSAVAIAVDSAVVWRHHDRAELTVRKFSEPFLDDYLRRAGDAVLSSVGCYQIEGLGAQLFDRVEGDYFTILGLPLLAVLAELRRQNVVAA